MLSLHTNIAGLTTQKTLTQTSKALTTSMTQLGTGYRINSAMDDAAGLQIATRLEAQSRGMKVAQRNTQNAISMLQTAEGALAETQIMVLRMKDLATEAANATASDADRNAMQTEYNELGKSILLTLGNTTFAGQRLFYDLTPTNYTLGGVFGSGSVQFQIGSSSDEILKVDVSTGSLATMRASFFDISASYISSSVEGTELSTQTTASNVIEFLNTTIDAISAVQSEFGAIANRLEHTFNNLSNMVQNTEVARGRIMDVDYASATSAMTRQQMLLQASSSLLKQSNQMGQMVASLLQ